MTERWKPVAGWEGLYEVSDLGRVRSLDRVVAKKDGKVQTYRSKVLSPRPSAHGHHYVQLCRDSKPRNVLVHRLVMAAFVGPCPPGLEVCHNDGDPGNNRLANLRYDTHSSNAYDSVAHGVHPHAKKSECKRGHAFNPPNTITRRWRDRTHRRCRACRDAFANHRGIPHDSDEFTRLADQYFRLNQKELTS